jgi:hypothetical protein
MRLSLGLGLTRRASGGGGGPAETYETVGYAGDSLGDQIAGAVRFSQAADWLDITSDERDYASGGMMFAVGGQTTAQILSTQLPQIEARTPDLLFEIGGSNDGMSTNGVADASMANRQDLVTGAIAAGVKKVIMLPMPPNNATPFPRSVYDYFNTTLKAWADAQDRVEWLDIYEDMRNPAELTNARFMLATDAFGGDTYDGVHFSLGWQLRTGNEIKPYLDTLGLDGIASTIDQLPGAYDPATSAVGDYVNGDEAQFLGTEGRMNGVLNAGVAGTSQWSNHTRWSLNTTAGFTVTPTKTTVDGQAAQQGVLSGTPSADGYFEMRWEGYMFGGVNNGDTSRLFLAEALLDLENVTGLYGVSIAANNLTGFDLVHATDTYSDSHRFPANYTDRLLLKTPRQQTISTDSASLVIRGYVKSGVAVSGTFRLSRTAIVRVV